MIGGILVLYSFVGSLGVLRTSSVGLIDSGEDESEEECVLKLSSELIESEEGVGDLGSDRWGPGFVGVSR